MFLQRSLIIAWIGLRHLSIQFAHFSPRSAQFSPRSAHFSPQSVHFAFRSKSAHQQVTYSIEKKETFS